jgi:chloride channel protein, CIC family
LVGMGATLGGVTRSPLTAIVFSFELTHDQNSLLALLVAATLAHLVSVLVLKRSILTEKVARRGFHVMREYAVDPLEAVFVREAMDADIYSVEPDTTVGDLYASLAEGSPLRRQRLYPVVVPDGSLVGVLPLSHVLEDRTNPDKEVAQLMISSFLVAYRDETLRHVAERMALSGVGVMPVVERADAGRMHGLITQFDLLTARQRLLQQERTAERILHLRRIRNSPQSRDVIAAKAEVSQRGGANSPSALPEGSAAYGNRSPGNDHPANVEDEDDVEADV